MDQEWCLLVQVPDSWVGSSWVNSNDDHANDLQAPIDLERRLHLSKDLQESRRWSEHEDDTEEDGDRIRTPWLCHANDRKVCAETDHEPCNHSCLRVDMHVFFGGN